MFGLFKVCRHIKCEQKVNFKFWELLLSEGLSEHRVLKYAFMLKNISKHIPTDFDRATEEIIREYVAHLEISSLSDWTKYDYKVTLKKFFKWLNGGEEPSSVKWIRTSFQMQDRKLPEDMFSEAK